MLDFMRKNARSVVVKVIYILIIIVFCFWGVGVMVGGERVNVAAMVDGESINAQAFLTAYERLQRSYQEVYRDGFTAEVAAQLNLEQRALDDLVTDLLLRREATRLGLQVSDDEVREAILNVPAFHADGHFDRNRYLAALRASRLTPAEFEDAQREALLIGKLEGILTDGLYVSDREVRDLWVMDNEKIEIAVARLPYDRFAGGADPSEEAIAAYYEERQAAFRTPEQITLAYVAYAPEGFRETVPATDDAIRAYYETHEFEFEAPEQILLRHVLIGVAPEAGDAAKSDARAEAEKVLEQAKGGADFAALAREHSDDPLSAEAGGDLGFVTRGTLEPALEGAAFPLEAGEVSGVVETPRGLHVLKVEERKPPTVRPLEEVREDVVRVIRDAGADDAAREALDADLERAQAGDDLEAIATARNLTVTTSPPTAPGMPLPGVKGGALFGAARAVGPGEVGQVVGAEPPYYLFKVVAKEPSSVQPLETARARIVESLRIDASKEAARMEAEGLLQEAVRGEDAVAALKSAAEAKGYAVEEIGPLGRNDTLSMLDNAPIMGDVFALTPQAPRAPHPYLLPKAAVAIVLKRRLPPDETELTPEARDTLRSTTITRRRGQLLEEYRNMLRQRADIRINPNVVTGAQG